MYSERRDAAKLKAQPELNRLRGNVEEKWLQGITNERQHSSQTVEVDDFSFPVFSYGHSWFSQTRVRLSSDKKQVETSQGACVSVKAAHVLYKMILAGKPVHGHVIDGYTVIGYNGALKIGCHEILRNEIDRFAEVMNW